MERTVFAIIMVVGTLCGIVFDMLLSANHQKEHNEKVPQSVHMLIIFGSVLLSIPIGCIAIVLIRWIEAFL